MKQNKSLVLGCIFAFIIGAAIIGYCIGKAGKPKVENRCPYEGAECPNAQHYLRDYQIEIYFDTVWIYDADRLVDKYTTTFTGQMDSVLLKDNL